MRPEQDMEGSGGKPADVESLQEVPIEEAVERASAYMRDVALQGRCVEALLERVRGGMDDRKGTKSLLQCISTFATPSAELSAQMLELCFIVEDVADVVELLPNVIRWPDDEEALLELVQSLLESDRQLLLPVISCLSSLPLSSGSQEAVFDIMTLGLQVAEENDMAVVVRGIMATCPARRCDEAVPLLRHALRHIPGQGTVCSLVLDVIVHSLSLPALSCPLVAEYFASIQDHCSAHKQSTDGQAAEGNTLIAMDVYLLLALLDRPKKRKKALALLLELIECGILSLHTLLQIVEQCPGYLQQNDSSALIWFCHELIVYKCTEESKQADLTDWPTKLAVQLFVSIGSSRMKLIQSLLSSCMLQALSLTFSSKQNLLKESHEAAKVLWHIAMDERAAPLLVACNGQSLFQDLLMHPSVALLPKRVYSLLSAALVSLCPHSLGLRDSLMIVIQKQVLGAGAHGHQQRGLDLALEMVQRNIMRKEEMEQVVDWVLRILPTAVAAVRSTLLRFLDHCRGALSSGRKEYICSEFIVPLAIESQLLAGEIPQVALKEDVRAKRRVFFAALATTKAEAEKKEKTLVCAYRDTGEENAYFDVSSYVQQFRSPVHAENSSQLQYSATGVMTVSFILPALVHYHKEHVQLMDTLLPLPFAMPKAFSVLVKCQHQLRDERDDAQADATDALQELSLQEIEELFVSVFSAYQVLQVLVDAASGSEVKVLAAHTAGPASSAPAEQQWDMESNKELAKNRIRLAVQLGLSVDLLKEVLGEIDLRPTPKPKVKRMVGGRRPRRPRGISTAKMREMQQQHLQEAWRTRPLRLAALAFFCEQHTQLQQCSAPELLDLEDVLLATWRQLTEEDSDRLGAGEATFWQSLCASGSFLAWLMASSFDLQVVATSAKSKEAATSMRILTRILRIITSALRKAKGQSHSSFASVVLALCSGSGYVEPTGLAIGQRQREAPLLHLQTVFRALVDLGSERDLLLACIALDLLRAVTMTGRGSQVPEAANSVLESFDDRTVHHAASESFPAAPRFSRLAVMPALHGAASTAVLFCTATLMHSLPQERWVTCGRIITQKIGRLLANDDLLCDVEWPALTEAHSELFVAVVWQLVVESAAMSKAGPLMEATLADSAALCIEMLALYSGRLRQSEAFSADARVQTIEAAIEVCSMLPRKLNLFVDMVTNPTFAVVSSAKTTPQLISGVWGQAALLVEQLGSLKKDINRKSGRVMAAERDLLPKLTLHTESLDATLSDLADIYALDRGNAARQEAPAPAFPPQFFHCQSIGKRKSSETGVAVPQQQKRRVTPTSVAVQPSLDRFVNTMAE